MKNFILKNIIIMISIVIIFKLTIGPVIFQISKPISKLTEITSTSDDRVKLKQKILNEIEKANNKDNYLSKEEAEIISKFIKKIISELNL